MAEAEAEVSENRDSGGGVDGDGGGNVGVGSGGGNGRRRWQWRLKQGQRWQRRGQWLWRWQTTTETAGAGNNQQKSGSGSGRDSGHGSGNCGSAALMAGRCGGTGEVTTMRAAATVTTVAVNIYPLEGRCVEVDTKKCQVDTNISGSWSTVLRGLPNFCVCDNQTLICVKFSKI